MTGAWVTTHGSQKAAARDGWDTAFEIPYEELGKLLEVTFDGVPPTCKFMVATVKQNTVNNSVFITGKEENARNLPLY